MVRQVVGVMPRKFLFPTLSQLWLPRTMDPTALPWGEGDELEVMGRLRPGVTMAQAKREFETICARIAQDHPKENEGVTPIVKPFTEEYIGEEPIIMLWTMMNVRNPNDSLLAAHPLPNTGRVVLRGNPVNGWTLVDWDGVAQTE